MSLHVTRVEINPPAPRDTQKVLGYARVTIADSLVIEAIRILQLHDGRIMVAMPSRPRRIVCHDCGLKVPITYDFCGNCGAAQWSADRHAEDRPRAYDFVYPVTHAARDAIVQPVLAAFLQWDAARKAAGLHHSPSVYPSFSPIEEESWR